MADNDLVITLRFAREAAEQASRAWHTGERQRIRDTSREEERARRQEASDARAARRLQLQEERNQILQQNRFARDARRQAAQERQADARAERALSAAFARAEREQIQALTREERDLRRQLEREVRETRRRELQDNREFLTRQRSDERDYESAQREARQLLASFARETRRQELREERDAAQAERETRRQLEREVRESRQQERSDHQQFIAGQRSESRAAAADERAQERARIAIIREGEREERDRDRARQARIRAWDRAQRERLQGMREEQRMVRQTENEVANLIKTYMGFSAAKSVVDGVTQSFESSSRVLAEMTEQFQKLREDMQQVAALTNKDNNSGFALDQIEKAGKANLRPQDWTNFQEEFQSYAGAALEGPGKKLEQDESEEYQAAIAKFMKASGQDTKTGGQLAGSLVSDTEGKQSVAQLKDRFGKVYKTLERSRTPVKTLLPQMSRLTPMGFSHEEAAQALAIVAPGSTPGEEGMLVQNFMRAIEEIETDDKGDEYGIKKGMSQYEKLKAVTGNLGERQAKGEDLAKEFKYGHIFQDARQRRGANAFVKSARLGNFEKFEGYAKDTPANMVDERNAAYSKSDAGKKVKLDAETAKEEAKVGAENERVSNYKQMIRNKVLESGAAKDVGEGGKMGLMGRLLAGSDPVQTTTNLNAIQNLRRKVEKSGVKMRYNDASDLYAARDNGLTDQLLRQMYHKLDEQNALLKKQLELQQRQKPAVPKPIAGPPPVKAR